MQQMPLLPFVVMAADYLENVSIVIMLVNFPNILNFVAQAASFFTTTKWLLVVVTFLLLLYGLGALYIRRTINKAIESERKEG